MTTETDWSLAVQDRMTEYLGHFGAHVRAYHGGAPFELALAVGALAWGAESWAWYVPPSAAQTLDVCVNTPPKLQVWAGCRHLNGRALAISRAHPVVRGRELWRNAARLALCSSELGDAAVDAAEQRAARKRPAGAIVIDWEPRPRLVEAPDDVLRRRLASGAAGIGAAVAAGALYLSWPRTPPPLPSPARIPT